jgi:para-aminobenzoate synthetase component 1
MGNDPAADLPALAVVGDRLLTDLVDVTSDLAALDSRGTWAVVLPFDGPPLCARFARVRPARPWPGPDGEARRLARGPHRWTGQLSARESKVSATRSALETFTKST